LPSSDRTSDVDHVSHHEFRVCLAVRATVASQVNRHHAESSGDEFRAHGPPHVHIGAEVVNQHDAVRARAGELSAKHSPVSNHELGDLGHS
jgi:hypothetical protein